MNEVLYKRCVIVPTVYQLADSNGWVAHGYIQSDTSNQTVVQNFLDEKGTFSTRNEAIQRCIDAGRQIIDGRLSSAD